MSYKRKLSVWGRAEKRNVPVEVTLDMDWNGIFAELAEKAYANRSKRTRALGGLIKATVKGLPQ